MRAIIGSRIPCDERGVNAIAICQKKRSLAVAGRCQLNVKFQSSATALFCSLQDEIGHLARIIFTETLNIDKSIKFFSMN
jgi:hypothetical protein